MDIVGNNQNFPAGSTSITLPTCGAQGATICATPGLGPYSWAGPNVPTNLSTPSMTNTCFTASLSATYTLTMEPPGSCQPIVKVITTTITPAPLIFASVVQAQCGNTLAVVSATPSGSASNSSTLTWSPNPFSTSQNNQTANFVIPPGPAPMPVFVTASDPLGCKITTSVSVEPGAPYPTFQLQNTTNSNSITCNTPALGFSVASTYTYGSLTYFWSSNSATFNTNPVNITIPGCYTVTITDPVTKCNADSVFCVGMNTVTPSVALTPTSQIITCNLSTIKTVTISASSPTVNLTLSVFSPLGGSLTSKSHTMQYIPAKPDIYTVTATNDVNGCVTTRQFTVTSTQGFPTFTVTSAENFSLGCGTRSVANINIVNASATGTDQVPNGGPVSYTLLSPSASSVTPPGTLSAVSNYTINVPGTWTVVTKDNSSFCETRLPISILSNTFSPHLNAIIPRNILDCNTRTIVAVGQSTTAGVSYNWNFPGTPGSQPGASITIVSNSVTPTASLIANYTLVITDNSSTCKSESVIPMYQSLYPPRAVISGSGALTCITQSIMLTNQSSSNVPPTSGFPQGQPVVGFLWAGPSPQQPLSNSTTYLAKVGGIYTLTAKDMNNGCTSQTTTVIGDNRDFPILNNPVAGPTGILDCGDNATAKIYPLITTPRTNLTYTWSGPPTATMSGVNTATLTANLVGEYVILVRDITNGCESVATAEIVPGVLTPSFTADQMSGFAPMTVKFTNNSATSTGTAGINSLWNFGNGAVYTSTVNAPTLTVAPGTPSNSAGVNASVSPTAIYTQPGTYSVTLYVSKGDCREKITKVITVDIPSELTIPNVFTPNNDGINDVYHLKATNLSEITMTIFDRWGHLVYELTSSTGNVLWDGKSQIGTEVAEGTYFYTIKATGKDGVSYDKNGTISVYR
jgi:gliding motility-associated-like protein